MPTPDLIMLTDPRSAAAEAFRTLRTNLMFSSVENPLQSLVVTAATDLENRSLTIANLAVAFAQAGNRTILVDADLRRPRQHEIWDVANIGLTKMMIDDAAIANPPLKKTEIGNLQILPAGEDAPNPADLLSSSRMQEIIGVLRARATTILFDAPPVLAVTDAAVLATKVDGILLVVRSGQSRRDQIERAREAIERVNARMVGAVLVDAPRVRSRKSEYA